MYRYLLTTLLVLCVTAPATAQSNPSKPQVWLEDSDDVLEAHEYRLITSDGATTRRPCPYTCEMRGVPRTQCKEWRSTDGQSCYVQDLGISNRDGMPANDEQIRARYREQYED